MSRYPRKWPGVKQRGGSAELVIVGTGRLAYLWWGDKDGLCAGHASGPKTLRKFAAQILAALDTPSKEPR